MTTASQRVLHYGSHRDQWLRVTPVPAAELCICLLHGGYWRARFTAALMAPLEQAFAGEGCSVANIEYRREQDAEAMRSDVVAALRLLRSTLGEARLVVIGHSAGGQLGLLAGADADAVVALAPVTDLVTGYAAGIGDGAVAELMGASPEALPDAYAAATPAPPAVPTLVVHGADDERVPVSQSRGFAAAARAAGAPLDVIEYARLGHMALIDPEVAHWPLVRAWIGALSPRFANEGDVSCESATPEGHHDDPGHR